MPLLVVTGFRNRCGKNPDFYIDKQGDVYPTAVDAKLKKNGGCTKVGVSNIFMVILC